MQYAVHNFKKWERQSLQHYFLTVFIAILASKLSTQLNTRSTAFSSFPPWLKHDKNVIKFIIYKKLYPLSSKAT